LNIVACPLTDGDWTPWVIEKEIPSQGEGEQSTKFGGPWPYWLHPALCCKFESEDPPLEATGDVVAVGEGVFGGGVAGGGLVGAGVLALLAFATVTTSDCSLDAPLESETETPKLKLPLAVGVPEIVPVLSASDTPCGSWPDTTANV
jgi:hypothetical protein